MGIKRLLYLTCPLLLGYESTRWLANPNRGWSHFLNNCWSSHEFVIHYHSEESRAQWMVINVPPIMLIIEPIMVIIFWVRSPISFKHMSFWVSVLGATPNRIPLKYRRPNKKWNWTRVVYSKVSQVLLSYYGTWLFSYWLLWVKSTESVLLNLCVCDSIAEPSICAEVQWAGVWTGHLVTPSTTSCVVGVPLPWVLLFVSLRRVFSLWQVVKQHALFASDIVN